MEIKESRGILIRREFDLVQIIPYARQGDKVYIDIPSEGGMWKTVEITMGEQIPWEVLSFRYNDALLLIEALRDALGDPKVEATVAELGAVKYHLEDMRRLVFNEDSKANRTETERSDNQTNT